MKLLHGGQETETLVLRGQERIKFAARRLEKRDSCVGQENKNAVWGREKKKLLREGQEKRNCCVEAGKEIASRRHEKIKFVVRRQEERD